ncbi:histidine phosphatase family protein [Nocardia takedensis]|uniref:histidine phosphatase family protein n=1 Tax=Nocardia takedensis TaxID=259390 RepID=UPI003F76B67C
MNPRHATVELRTPTLSGNPDTLVISPAQERTPPRDMHTTPTGSTRPDESITTGSHRARGLQLLLIRHGESWSNIENTISGRTTCRGLTDLGHRQARAVADRLAAAETLLRPTIVYSTAVPRAEQTAAPIAEALEVELRTEFPYQEHGAAEGRTRHRLPSAPPVSPDEPVGPGADSWASGAVRVAKMLDILTARHHGDTIALVCHRETILAAAQHFQCIVPTLHYATAEVDYTAITEWHRRPRGSDPRHWRWSLIRHNDNRHLPGPDQASATLGSRRALEHF